MMKITHLYGLVLLILLIFVGALFNYADEPERQILGQWQELQWAYEKKETQSIDNEMTEDVKDLLGKSLLIHQAEEWKFLPNGKLLLINEDGRKVVDWRLKGRGNILQIKYDKLIENYNVSILNKDTLVLNFDSNVQARGIAKLTFSRNL